MPCLYGFQYWLSGIFVKWIYMNVKSYAWAQYVVRGYRRICKMKVLVRSHLWWRGIDTDIDSIAKSCEICLSLKNKPPISPLQPWSWPANPWQRVHVDFAGSIFGWMYLLAIDTLKVPRGVGNESNIYQQNHYYSKTYILHIWVTSTDNRPQFIAEEFGQFCRENGVKHIRSSFHQWSY